MANRGGDGWTDGRKDGHLEIPPCVLQDIGPLGPLPKKLKIAEIVNTRKSVRWTAVGRMVAEWLRLLPSDSKVAGSIPVCVPLSDVAFLA